MKRRTDERNSSTSEGCMGGDGTDLDVVVEGDGPPFLLAHGAGGSARSPFLAQLAAAVAAEGRRVVRFSFPYAAAGRRAPDRPAVLLATWRAVCERYGGPDA